MRMERRNKYFQKEKAKSKQVFLEGESKEQTSISRRRKERGNNFQEV